MPLYFYHVCHRTSRCFNTVVDGTNCSYILKAALLNTENRGGMDQGDDLLKSRGADPDSGLLSFTFGKKTGQFKTFYSLSERNERRKGAQPSSSFVFLLMSQIVHL